MFEKEKVNVDVSIVLTTYNESEYLNSVLNDLSKQQWAGFEIEILLLEAGDYHKKQAEEHLGVLSEKLQFFHFPSLSRTESLNYLFEQANGRLIIRLDARSHIDTQYIQNIFNLSISTGAEIVGGIMVPIGNTLNQKHIAYIMKHPIGFGGGKFRNLSYKGYADSVYLGAYLKEKCRFGQEWFDSVHTQISEDSDLNYRIRKNKGKVFIDSAIRVEHFPRESLSKFFKLCFNYGVGRGLFIVKHKVTSAWRQLVPRAFFIGLAMLFCLGFHYTIANYLLYLLIGTYFSLLSWASFAYATKTFYFFFLFFGFLGCHLFWTLGLLKSPYSYMINRYKNS